MRFFRLQTLLSLLLCLCSVSDAEDCYVGHQYKCSTIYNANWNYLWTANYPNGSNAGAFSNSSQSTCIWHAPSTLINPAGDIINLSILVSHKGSRECSTGCTAQDSVDIHLLPNSTSKLYIEKVADSPAIGGRVYDLTYTINYGNQKDGIPQTNVSITDIVDKNFAIPSDINPWPSKISPQSNGSTVLTWDAATLGTQSMAPGICGTISFRAKLKDATKTSTVDQVYNYYKIDSDQTAGKFNVLSTSVIHSLYITKTADKQVYKDGEIVNYTITYGNHMDIAADNTTIFDVLPDPNYMEYVDAYPEPNTINNNTLFWSIGTIPANGNGTIQLYTKIRENHTELSYRSDGYVSGEGFANIHQSLNTAQKPDSLTNQVTITGYYQGVKDAHSSSATIYLADALGTAVNIHGHGSGSYTREDKTQMLLKNRSIKVETSLSENYHPTTFALPQGRSINFSSKWSESQTSQNRITGGSLSEVYMYANRIKRDSSILLDKNGSTLSSQTSFEGSGHIGVLKRSNTSDISASKVIPTYESQEDYLGRFNVYTYLDEYGKNVVSNSSVSGMGFVATDKHLGNNQRSYESGTGSYQTEEQTQTQTNYMAKNINVTYEPMSYAYTPDVNISLSKKWDEGMWSKSGTFTQRIHPARRNHTSLDLQA